MESPCVISDSGEDEFTCLVKKGGIGFEQCSQLFVEVFCFGIGAVTFISLRRMVAQEWRFSTNITCFKFTMYPAKNQGDIVFWIGNSMSAVFRDKDTQSCKSLNSVNPDSDNYLNR